MRARVFEQYQDQYQLRLDQEPIQARLSGKLRHNTLQHHELPVAGDYVDVELTAGAWMIHAVEQRKNVLLRKSPGRGREAQALAANVDTALVLTSLDHDFSLRRLERYLIMVLDAGARPVVVLNKADIASEVEQSLAAAKQVAREASVHSISALTGENVAPLAQEVLRPGETIALCGSSGVGKSTLVNRLVPGAKLETQPVREADSKGRHTTTTRKMIEAGGVYLIDLPGLRELQLWDSEAGLDAAFDDVATLSRSCKFRDCTHTTEPGCAVREAVSEGQLDQARFENYLKAEKEARWSDQRGDRSAEAAAKRRAKSLSKEIRRLYKDRGRDDS